MPPGRHQSENFVHVDIPLPLNNPSTRVHLGQRSLFFWRKYIVQYNSTVQYSFPRPIF